MLGSAAALVAAVFWWGRVHPSELADLGLGLLAPSSGVSVGEVDVSRPGKLFVRQLKLTEGVTVGEVEVTYSGRALSAWRDGEVEEVTLRGGQLQINDALLAQFGGESGAGSAAGAGASGARGPASGVAPWWARAVPQRLRVDGVELRLDVQGLPAVTGKASVDLEEVRPLIAGGGGVRVGALSLADAVWRGEGAPDPVSFERLEADLDISPDFGQVAVGRASVTGLKADLTREGLAVFLDAPAEQRATGGASPEITIGKLEAKGAELSFSGLDQLAGLEGARLAVDFELAGLTVIDGTLRSTSEQSLGLGRAEIFAPGATAGRPLLAWERAELRAVPDDLLERGEVAAVRIDGLRADVARATLGDLFDPPLVSGAGADLEAVPAAPAGGDRPLLAVRDLRVAGASLDFDPDGLVEGVPAASAKLEMRSEAGLDTGDGNVRYAAELTELAVRVEAGDPKPFATGAKIVAEFSAVGLQREGVIDAVTVSGVRAEVGDAVQRLAEAAPSPSAERDEPGAPVGSPETDGEGLSISRLEIDDTAITLRDLVPGALPVLTIGIDTSLQNVPLIGRSRGDEQEQRIEVKGVRIASQYNPLQNVAELETVWVYFTIPGLFRQEIRRVEVVGPSVYVGEPLFWFVDYMRKYAEGEGGEGGSPGGDGQAAAGGAAGGGDAIVEGLKGFEVGGWKFGQLRAHAGKIIVAPTGTPLGIVPFPFEVATDFAKGEISVEVEVPSGDYVFEQLELEFRDLSGRAYVNYPVAGVNNNFVQTFQAPVVKFQQFEGEEVWLSVTYDENGIYGSLGGEAYNGYVEGGFNLYVEGPYRWDAWVSGTGFDLGSFTEVLAPETLRMRGVVDGKFIAEGQQFDVAKATGELATRGAGTMHVIKLDDLREALPEDWEPLWKAIANAGIDAFRDYDFATGTADVAYEGGEGVAEIAFDGEQGGRKLELRLFDRRGGRSAGGGQEGRGGG